MKWNDIENRNKILCSIYDWWCKNDYPDIDDKTGMFLLLPETRIIIIVKMKNDASRFTDILTLGG